MYAILSTRRRSPGGGAFGLRKNVAKILQIGANRSNAHRGLELMVALSNSRSGIRRRLLSALGSNVYGQAVNIFIQLVVVSVLVRIWGPEKYGLWLIITAVPSYIALSDLGFCDAAGNDMALSLAKHDIDAAVKTYQSVYALLLAAICIIAIVAFGSLVLVPSDWLPQSPSTSSSDARLALGLLIVQTLLVLIVMLFTAGFRACGHYALGYNLLTNTRLLELGAMLFGAYAFDSITVAALGMVAGRVIMAATSFILLRKHAPFFRLGLKNADLSELKRLAPPAVAMVVVTAALALQLQGSVLVLGALVPLSVVTTFVTVRTLTRMVVQAAALGNHAILPELTIAYGKEDWSVIARLRRLNHIVVLGPLLAGSVGILAFGQFFLRWWTGGKVEADLGLIMLLTMAACFQSYWLTQGKLLMAINRHQEYAYSVLFVFVLALGLLALLVVGFGLHGAAIAAIVTEMVAIVLIQAKVWRAFRAPEPLVRAGT